MKVSLSCFLSVRKIVLLAAVRWTNNHLLAALTPPAQKFVSNSEIRFLRTTTVHQSISSSVQASPSARSFASSFAGSAGRGRWRGHRSRFSTTSDSGGPPWSLCTGRRERRRSHTNSLNIIGKKNDFSYPCRAGLGTTAAWSTTLRREYRTFMTFLHFEIETFLKRIYFFPQLRLQVGRHL